jgi:hypothetical protein
LQQLGVELVFVFSGIPYAGGHHCPTNVKRLLAVHPDMAKVLAVVALHKASLNSV